MSTQNTNDNAPAGKCPFHGQNEEKAFWPAVLVAEPVTVTGGLTNCVLIY